jgi:hypothetical protein
MARRARDEVEKYNWPAAQRQWIAAYSGREA